MTQKYPNGMKVRSPGTVIISTAAEVSNISKTVTPVLYNDPDTLLVYIDFSDGNYELGGSSFAQALNSVGNLVPDAAEHEYISKAFNVIQELIMDDLILAGHDISAGGLITSLLELCFTQKDVGLYLSLEEFGNIDLVKLLFSENPAVIIQVKDHDEVFKRFREAGIRYKVIGNIVNYRSLVLKGGLSLDINKLRDVWFSTSFEFDKNQTTGKHAELRLENYKTQELKFKFPDDFTGKYHDLRINPKRKGLSGCKAAIIREKGVNGDREMAWAMHLAGFDVKDVHMTDLISGQDDLSEVNFIVFVGGFSNSDVLGSAKGWAGSFLFNPKANTALKQFYAREDTLSLGVCNGCQLMMELGLIYPNKTHHPKMQHNASGKFESSFLNVTVRPNNTVMLENFDGTELGIWVAHGEGRFVFQKEEKDYNIPLIYSHFEYPGNPNGSAFNAAAVSSEDGRHLAIMPHLERSIYPWNWAFYPKSRYTDQVSPWIRAFINARNWIVKILN